MGVQKLGARLEVFGADEKKKPISLAAAEHRMCVEFTDQTMQMAYEQARQIQNGRGLGRERWEIGR